MEHNVGFVPGIVMSLVAHHLNKEENLGLI